MRSRNKRLLNIMRVWSVTIGITFVILAGTFNIPLFTAIGMITTVISVVFGAILAINL